MINTNNQKIFTASKYYGDLKNLQLIVYTFFLF